MNANAPKNKNKFFLIWLSTDASDQMKHAADCFIATKDLGQFSRGFGINVEKFWWNECIGHGVVQIK